MNSLQLRLQVEYLRPETNAGLFEREQRQIHKNVSRQTAGDTKSLLGQGAQDSALLPDPARDAYCPKAPRTMSARRVPRAGTAPESVPCPARLLAPPSGSATGGKAIWRLLVAGFGLTNRASLGQRGPSCFLPSVPRDCTRNGNSSDETDAELVIYRS